MASTCSTVPRPRRFPIEADVTYRLVGNVRWHAGRTLNISRTGVLFSPSALRAPPVHSHIEFMLDLPSLGVPGRARVHCVGRVVRQVPVAGRFSPDLALSIERYAFLGPSPPTRDGEARQPWDSGKNVQ